MLCYVGAPRSTRQERCPGGIIAYKIAAHAADLAKGHPGAHLRTRPCLRRASSSAGKQFNLALDPERARAYPESSAIPWARAYSRGMESKSREFRAEGAELYPGA